MTASRLNGNTLLIPAVIFLAILAYPPSEASSQVRLSEGETVYVSIYSNVYSGPKKVPFQLAAMLSIRNTDPKYPITILQIDYYDNNGVRIDRYIKEGFELEPLASEHFYIKEYDRRGGAGANFIVKWRSTTRVNQPIIEGIMLASGRGLSFICPGQIIKEHDD